MEFSSVFMFGFSILFWHSGICPFCGQMKSCLRKHIHVVHEKIKNFFCDLCGNSAYAKRHFIDHMLSHLPKAIKCPHCSFLTSTEKYLRQHIANKHEPQEVKKAEGGQKFPCRECNFEFKSIHNLNGHILRKHQMVRDFHCDVCAKSFYASADLKQVFGLSIQSCDLISNIFQVAQG